VEARHGRCGGALRDIDGTLTCEACGPIVVSPRR
jgi:hypothetical protein